MERSDKDGREGWTSCRGRIKRLKNSTRWLYKETSPVRREMRKKGKEWGGKQTAFL